MTNLGKGLIPLLAVTMALIGEEQCCYEECCPPKKCIDCECYNPMFYEMRCDWGIFATGDFLYWYASETNLEYANLIQYTTQPIANGGFLGSQYGFFTKHKYLHANWKPGLRVGVGVHTLCDGWDFFLNWTYFDNNSHGSTSRPLSTTPAQLTATGLVNGVNDPWAAPVQVPGYTQINAPRVSAKWSLIFNQMDLEFGRKFWVSKWMTIRPYTGIRGAWTHTNFRVDASYGPITYLPMTGLTFVAQNQTVTETATIINRFRNRFWGVGILGGMQPEFHFASWCSNNFSLYGNFEGALIWGKHHGRNHYRLRVTTNDNENLNPVGLFPPGPGSASADPTETDSYSRMHGILDVGIGLRWMRNWCCDRWSTSIDLGWEHHYWFNFGLYHRPIYGSTFFGPTGTDGFSVPRGTNNFVTDIGFGGLVVRARLDF